MKYMCITDCYDMNLAVKVALTPKQLTNQSILMIGKTPFENILGKGENAG